MNPKDRGIHFVAMHKFNKFSLCIILVLLTLACAVVIDWSSVATHAPTSTRATGDSLPTSSPMHTKETPPTSPLSPTEAQSDEEEVDIKEVQRGLDAFLNSPWALELSLPAELLQRWEAIAAGAQPITPEEARRLSHFLERMQTIERLLEERRYPSGGQPVVRARFLDEQHAPPIPYLIEADQTNGAGEHLYAWTRDEHGEIVAITPAPWIEGLVQQISEDGDYVAYLRPGKEVIFKADVQQLSKGGDLQKHLLEMIQENILMPEDRRTQAYLRAYFNLTHIRSAFFGVGELTFNQVLLLQSVVELYNRAEMQELAEYVFAGGEQVHYIVSRVAHPYAAAMARPLGGTPPQGIIVLYTKNLFDNKYETAASIAHEAAHIWQGPAASCNNPEARLKAEIGNGIVSQAFYSWSASNLYQAVLDGEAGAYHATLWVLLKFNQARQAEWVKGVIRTGTANGQSIINCP